jgi:hypothetical protein
LKDLIFIDESGVNLAMVRLYARSLKGERAKGPKPRVSASNFVFKNTDYWIHL